MLSNGYGLCTECAQSRGPENIGLKRTCPAAVLRTPVLSLTRITLENNEKIRIRTRAENGFAGGVGGGDGPDV